MSEEDVKRYHEMYTVAWRFFRKYSNPDGTQEFWKQLCDEVQELDRQYKSKFLRDALNTVTAEIDRLDRGVRDN